MALDMNRREFLKIMGTTAATAVACTTPRTPEKLIPYVIPPEDQIPGIATWYASTCWECPAGCGILIKNREGRPIKIEGNPDHPHSQGGVCARGHAALFNQYHPDRYRSPLRRGSKVSWEEALSEVVEILMSGKVAVVTGELKGTLGRIFDRFAQNLGALRIVFEPLSYTPLIKATEIATGRAVTPLYHLEEAQFILDVGADLLETWINPVGQQKRLARARRPENMAKLVVVEPRLSLTGANADEWIPLPPGKESLFLLRLLIEVYTRGGPGSLTPREEKELNTWIKDVRAGELENATGIPGKVYESLARDLLERVPALVVTGGAGYQGSYATQFHLLGLIINRILGVVGKTVTISEASTMHDPRNNLAGVETLFRGIEAGKIKTVILYKSDLVYALPPEFKAKENLEKLDHLISLDPLPNETTELAEYILPDHGVLESWGDVEAYEGYYAIRQPMLTPLFDTRPCGDTLILLALKVGKSLPWESFTQALRERAAEIQLLSGDSRPFAAFYEELLRKGGVSYKKKEKESPLALKDLHRVPLPRVADELKKEEEVHLIVYPHIFRYDGRGANVPWLQENPDPVQQTSWSSWVEIHPTLAKRYNIENGDRIRLVSESGSMESYALITTTVRPDVIAVAAGQGHTRASGRYAGEIEGNPFKLLKATKDGLTQAWVWGGTKVRLQKVAPRDLELISGIDYHLVTMDGEKNQLGRQIVQMVPLFALKHVHDKAMPRGGKPSQKDGEGANGGESVKAPHPGETILQDPNGFYPPHEHPEHRWGMVIDLNACVGCGACTISCMVENNIPFVGKTQVAKGREMFWIRIERYFEGDEAGAGVRFIPMLCQQCNNAPCETVCPVLATMHNVEGLNAMVYNRCVGTRYCANNCPYKVRRFNWFGYDDPQGPYFRWEDPLPLMLNPDVTVRSKGVMEKCTFCIQRIREVTEVARIEGRPVRDGEIIPACAQSCPSEAIVFGDLNDPESRVSHLARDPRGYRVLELLNTQPAVTYLKKVTYTA